MARKLWKMPEGAVGIWNAERGVIRRLPLRPLTDEELRQRLELRRSGNLRICYAPLDYMRTGARVAVVGLTPGEHTFRASVTVAQELLRAGRSDATVLRRAKETAPFSDPGTRARLIRWLDDLGVARALDLATCGEFYSSAAPLVHWTSLIRYPVFRWSEKKQKWINYSGTPQPIRHFDDVIRGAFVPELRRLKAEVVFTLGDKVRDTTALLAADGQIDGRRLVSLPHPSGQNVGVDDEYARRRPRLRGAVKRLLG